jgi:signal transduction histidine kinase
VAVTLVIALVISADQDRRQSPDAIAYSFACGFGALMLVRRRFPAAVLVITMFGLFAYYTLGYPAIGLAVPVAAALYSAAELGRLWVCIVVSLTLISVSTYFRLQDGTAVAYLFYELVSTVTLMAAAIALGVNTRSRRALRAEQEQTARLIEQEHAYRAEQRIQAERLHMARDLHDVIGHSISVIALQSDVVRESIGNNEEQARKALGHIRAASSDTMRELRNIVRLLRSSTEAQPDLSVNSLSNLSTLVENAKASGLSVDVCIEGEITGISATLDTSAYRIIQESLTNVIRHANATHVTLKVSVDKQGLGLQIIDNGTTAVGAVVPGRGIGGMQERARLLGGKLAAQPLPGGGFQVKATLPRQETP